MSAVASNEAPAAMQYASYLRELHSLIAQGKNDSVEAEAMRDHMDESWSELTLAEQDRLRGLSEDLYHLLEGNNQTTDTGSSEAIAWRSEKDAAFAEYKAGKADRLLALLRQPAPPDFPTFPDEKRPWMKCEVPLVLLLSSIYQKLEEPQQPHDLGESQLRYGDELLAGA